MPVGDLTFQDNAPLLKTLEHPRDGVFALLNSECVRRDGKDENLLKQLLKKHERAPFVGERRGPLPGVFVPRVSVKSTSAERADALSVFGVSHFAADVSYRINAFVEKNRDRLPNEICALAATSDAPWPLLLYLHGAGESGSRVARRESASFAPASRPETAGLIFNEELVRFSEPGTAVLLRGDEYTHRSCAVDEGQDRLVLVFFLDFASASREAHPRPPASAREVSFHAPDAGAPLAAALRACLLYTSPSPRDRTRSRMPSSA